MTDANDPIPQIARDDEAAGSGNMVADNIGRLKALFPEMVTDGKVDFDVLRELLGDAVDEGEERYGLNWKGKRKARAFALTPSLGTLRPAPEDSLDWDSTQNLMIEGDNLEVLKLLRRSYAGEAKLIYIDPPYNTGNDFVYPDRYQSPITNYFLLTGQVSEDEEILTSDRDSAGRRHGDWLTMIYPRMMLAKELLSDQGVLVVHLDEHEIDSMTLLLKEIFGEENHVGTIVWDKRNPKGDARGIAYQHEQLLVFAKHKAKLLEAGPLQRPKRGASGMLAEARRIMAKSANVDEARSAFKAWVDDQPGLTGGERMYFRLSEDGRVYRLVSMAWPNKSEAPEEYFKPLKHPVTGLDCPVPDRGWRNPPDTMAALLSAGLIEFGADHNTQPQRIYYLDENLSEKIASIVPHGGSDDALLARYELPFDQPKPVALATSLVQWFTGPNDLVVDFFAGSGTTGHAVLAQNVADDGRRRFILVQLPEPLDPGKREQKAAAKACDKLKKPRNIAELTKHRLRKVRADLKGEQIDTGFRVYKLTTSNLKPWQPDAEDLEASILDAVDNVLPGRTEEDLLVELLLKTGIDLTLPEEKITIAGQTVHALGGGTLMVCLGNIGTDDAEALGQGMADWVEELDPVQTTVYFKDTGLGADGNRAATKANLAAILRQRLGDRIAKIASI